MKINPGKCSSLHEGRGEGPTKLYVRKPINSGIEQLQILGNNHSSDLSWADHVNYTVKKGLERNIFHNAYTQKGEL